MEAQIKEEIKDASLCFETSGDNLPNISLVDKYDRFIQNEEIYDSDGDSFPDDTILKKEYAQLTRGITGLPELPNKRRSLPFSNHNLYHSKDSGNGVTMKPNDQSSEDNVVDTETSSKPGHTSMDELIDRLAEVRRTGLEGNSCFCEPDEQELIRERYAAILDSLYERSSTFERRSSSKDSDNEEQVDVGKAAPADQREIMKMINDKRSAVQVARDRFYEVEQQVKEQVEQLELVERYKMESVG